MPSRKPEENIFEMHLCRKRLKHSYQRSHILKVFLKSRRHLTARELHGLARRGASGIGFATIYRTLKIFCDSGICREMKLEDGLTRYEVLGREHHDHLICIRCGGFVEVMDARIEGLQEELARRHGFALIKHRFELYGLCSVCRRKK